MLSILGQWYFNDDLTVYNVVLLLLTYAALIFVCLPLHELSHGFIAYKLGDNTAKWHGRLTLNPLKHLDLFGTLMLVLCGFGYAKPVPVNPYNFRKPKNGMALTALAGPASNLLMAIIAVGLFRLVYFFCDATTIEFGGIHGEILYYAYFILIRVFASVNLGLTVFNLLPIPPLDGSRIFAAILPDRWVQTMERYEMYVQVALMAVLLTGVLDTPLYWLRHGFGFVICTLFGMPNVF